MSKALLVDGNLHQTLRYYAHAEGVAFPLARIQRAHVHQLLRTLDLVLREDHLSAIGQELLALLDALQERPNEVLAACRRNGSNATPTARGRDGDNGRQAGVPDSDPGAPALPAAA